ncbi:hypothetical protein PTSG_12816 [Salpingoeca rosetta]|uniref:Protein zer-1 homolog-like C-terminal domain-containing protein n=1 Tax=Salpingoeca rosetta (strain ATCC 50818 / BSB-021) TaxID=946362 RepID=F2ULR6_SALR5|nr:uncharacterized protein PTSG_12816 [Salpingoeca rosetta]EGD78065.1 hypothetical protein PTSG_12816 [Salpingoeca rosetta]|eukprot:XP_004989741.1 hypothetical protein PTSG_12816 [Salpingoeca rosetta]
MNMHPDTKNIQFQGCAALAGLANPYSEAYKEQHTAHIVEHGGIEAVIRAMGNYVRDARVQQSGCSALRHISYQRRTAQNAFAIAEQGGVEAVLVAMAAHPDNAYVQHQGCAALQKLTYYEDLRGLVVAADGIDAILRALHHEDHRRNSRVQQQGLRALRNLALDSDANRRAIVDGECGGGVAATLRAMQKFQDATGIQVRGCSLMWQLAHVDHAKHRFIANKGVDLVLGALQKQKHAHDPYLVLEACGALAKFAEDDATRADMVSKGGAGIVAAAMARHESKDNYKARHRRKWGCVVLCTLLRAGRREDKAAVVENGGVGAVLCAMEEHPHARDLQRKACEEKVANAMDKLTAARQMMKQQGMDEQAMFQRAFQMMADPQFRVSALQNMMQQQQQQASSSSTTTVPPSTEKKSE